MDSTPDSGVNTLDRALYLTNGVIFEMYNWSGITVNDRGTDGDFDLFDDDGYDYPLTLNGRWIAGEI